MLYCLDHHIQFKLCSKQANFDSENGWEGFFEPFCEEVTNNIDKHYKFTNWRYALKRIIKGDLHSLYYIFPNPVWRQTIYTQDIFEKSRNVSLKRKYYIPQLNINGDIVEACSKLVEITWRYKPLIKEKIENYIQSINLPSSYVGLHIRGGDKYIEAQIVKTNLYMEKAESLSDKKEAFILTDDYRVFENIKMEYPNWTFYTLCDPDEQGYFHAEFISEDPNKKKEKLIRLFASMDILAKSFSFIGTFSSNPGMFLGMRMPIDKSFGVDFPNWRIW